MTTNSDADVQSIIQELHLEPALCGFMAPIFRGNYGAALFFLISPERPGRLHRLDADQIYHYCAGERLEVLLETSDGPIIRTLGPYGEPNCSSHIVIEAGTLHGSRTLGSYTLASTTSFSTAEPVVTSATAAELADAAVRGFR